MTSRFMAAPPQCLLVTFDQQQCGKSAEHIAARLESLRPAVLAIHEGDKIGFVMDVLTDDEVVHIGNCVREILDA
jgi:hypothetical protein